MRRQRISPLSLAVLGALLVTPFGVGAAQSSERPGARIKVNAVTTLVGVPGVGVERPLNERWSFQFDATLSPWRSVDGLPMQLLILIPEWRYHFGTQDRGWYAGGHAGASWFRLQKWDHRGSDRYQEGFGVLFGGTLGYQRPIDERWGVEAFLGGGNSQALYKGYFRLTGERYDTANGWNQSGEWIAYRGGVMLTYRRGRGATAR